MPCCHTTEDGPKVQTIDSGPRHQSEQPIKRSCTAYAMKSGHKGHKPGRNKLDTRADTICVRKNWHILSTTDQCCNVHRFHDNLKP